METKQRRPTASVVSDGQSMEKGRVSGVPPLDPLAGIEPDHAQARSFDEILTSIRRMMREIREHEAAQPEAGVSAGAVFDVPLGAAADRAPEELIRADAGARHQAVARQVQGQSSVQPDPDIIDLDALADELIAERRDIAAYGADSPWRELESLLGVAHGAFSDAPASAASEDVRAPQPEAAKLATSPEMLAAEAFASEVLAPTTERSPENPTDARRIKTRIPWPSRTIPAPKSPPPPQAGAASGSLSDAFGAMKSSLERVEFEASSALSDEPDQKAEAASSSGFDDICDISDLEEEDAIADIALSAEIAPSPRVVLDAAEAVEHRADDVGSMEEIDLEAREMAPQPFVGPQDFASGETGPAKPKLVKPKLVKSQPANSKLANSKLASPPQWRNQDPRNAPGKKEERAMRAIARRVAKIAERRIAGDSAPATLRPPNEKLAQLIGVYQPALRMGASGGAPATNDDAEVMGAANEARSAEQVEPPKTVARAPTVSVEQAENAELPAEALRAIEGPEEPVKSPVTEPPPESRNQGVLAEPGGGSETTLDANGPSQSDLKHALADWLNQNLSGLLEELVREEIARRSSEKLGGSDMSDGAKNTSPSDQNSDAG